MPASGHLVGEELLTAPLPAKPSALRPLLQPSDGFDLHGGPTQRRPLPIALPGPLPLQLTRSLEGLPSPAQLLGRHRQVPCRVGGSFGQGRDCLLHGAPSRTGSFGSSVALGNRLLVGCPSPFPKQLLDPTHASESAGCVLHDPPSSPVNSTSQRCTSWGPVCSSTRCRRKRYNSGSLSSASSNSGRAPR